MLLPTYKLLILLFIVTLCANIVSFFTVTFIVLVDSAPLLSVTLYVTLYSPGTFTLTVFSKTSILVIAPSSLSVAVTPINGLKSSPTFITLSSAFITGNAFTITVIVFLASAPLLSVTLYVTLYVPATFSLTVFSITSILVIVPSSLSVAVTPSKGSNFCPTFISLSLASIFGIAFIIPPGILGFTISSSFLVNTFLSSDFNSSLFATEFFIFMFI